MDKTNIPVSQNSYSCPKCDCVSSHESLIKRDEMEPNDNGGFDWDELHKCQACKIEYLISNGI